MSTSNSSPVILLFLLYLVNTSQSFSHIRALSFKRHQHQCSLSQVTNLEATPAPQESGSQPSRPTRRKSNSQQPKQRRKKKTTPTSRTGTVSPQQNRLLNHQIVQSPNAQDLINFLASTKGALTNVGGGGSMNSVNFSTALHRIARHIQFYHQNEDEGNNRSRVLADPRFALLACSAAEALVGGDNIRDSADRRIVFGSREMSNIAWAIAKLKISPPKNVMPVDISSNSEKLLTAKSEQVRSMIYEVAKERASSKAPAQKSPWIPALSELCGIMMDTISYRVMEVDPTLFRLQEWANLLWALATAQRANDEVFNFVISSLMSGMKKVDNTDNEGLRPQEWSNSIWALATSGITGPEEELLPFVANLMDSYPDFLNSFKPQELSNTVWGVATIISKRPGQPEGPACDAALIIVRHVARQLVERQGEGYKSQELTNSVWAFATLGFGLSINGSSDFFNTLSDYTVLRSDDGEGDRILMEEAIQVVTRIAKKGLRRFRSQELNNIAWTMARLGQGDEKLLEQIGTELCNPRRIVSSQDIGTSLWSFATLEYFNEDIYRAIAARVTKDRAMYSKPQELSNTLWALATADMVPKFIDLFDTSLLPPGVRPSLNEAEADPVTMCFAFASQELIRRPHEFKTQEIKDILWALSRVRIRHPVLFKSVAEHLVGSGDRPEITGRGLEDFSVQGLGNLAWAFARQAQLGAEVISRFDGKTTVPVVSGRLAHYITSFIDVGEGLLQKLFRGIAETDLQVHDNLSKLKPQDLSNTAWAFAILGMKHTSFLSAVVDQLRDRTQRHLNGNRRDVMTRFKGQEITNTLWALATLNYCPSQGLVHQIEPYLVEMTTNNNNEITVDSISRVLNRQELANIAWVCAVFGEYPTQLIKLLYTGLLGVGERPDPAYLQKVHRDGGLQPSATMSILYLQIVMDLEQGNSNNVMFLPDNFPEKWDSDSSSYSRGGGDTTMDCFELRLTSSKIQQSVSRGFERIGFSHVEEHVIGMDTLSMDHGIKMASNNPREVLSLDIADVESQIGIEVDGPGHFVSNIDDHHGSSSSAGETRFLNGKLEYSFCWDSEHQEINGPTALKVRILQQIGWRVINIPFWEWYNREGDTQKEEDYCRSVLNDN